MSPLSFDSDLLTEAEAAGFLRVRPTTLRDWRHSKRGPAFVRMTNRTIRYLRHDLDEFVAIKSVMPELGVNP